MSNILPIQQTYFEIVDKHLKGPLQPVWSMFDKTIGQDPNVYDPVSWSSFLTPSSMLLVPIEGFQWTSSVRRHLSAFVTEIADFWRVAIPDLFSEIQKNDAYYFYVHYSKLHQRSLIQSARIYFDSICLQDPISLLETVLNLREVRIAENTKQFSSRFNREYRTLIDTGLDVQISSVLYSLWWLLRYRKVCLRETSFLEAFVVPRTPDSSETFFPATESKLAEKMALRFVSEVTGIEFQSAVDVITTSDKQKVPWLKIATQNNLVNSLFRTGDEQASEEAILETIKGHSSSVGLPVLNLLDHASSVGKTDLFIGRGIYDWLRFRSGERLDCLWQASSVGADAAIMGHEWTFEIWLMRSLSLNTKTPSPMLSPSQLAGLTIQSDKLVFLGNLTDEEIAFIRQAPRLAEMRELLSSDHATCRNEMGRGPELAEAAAARFIHTIEAYKHELEAVVARVSESRASRILRKVKDELLELGLTSGVGALGLIIAPPWSLIFTALGLVVGGQSMRGILASVARDEVENEITEHTLRCSALSVCLRALE